ncbi:tripartite tricarboxylate transporter TctB family protein [Gracilibacillus suaedae]|uniref:tripartite tricarboxylate transporter TctB family protein n=1 Tax=Gracilibacillus suaedae TaxID=2820273 RepID=UPI001ABDB1AE|nr:tripartite tricarboxylate transporter TctB family protein [Gracilibacillus suaedae]
MRITNVSFNLILLLICGLLYWQTYNFSTLFGSDGIGPAYFPRLIIILIMITNIIELFFSIKTKSSKRLFLIEHSRRVLELCLFIAVIAGFISLLGTLPFILIASISMFLLCMVLKLPLIPSILVSVGLSVVVHFVFIEGFNIML